MRHARGRILGWIVVIALAAVCLVGFFSQGKVPLGSAVVVESPILGSFRVYTGGRYYALVGVERVWPMEISAVELGLSGSQAVRATTGNGVDVLVDVRLAYSMDVLELSKIVEQVGPDDPASGVKAMVRKDVETTVRDLVKGLTYDALLKRRAWLSEELLSELTDRLREQRLTLRRLSVRNVQRAPGTR